MVACVVIVGLQYQALVLAGPGSGTTCFARAASRSCPADTGCGWSGVACKDRVGLTVRAAVLPAPGHGIPAGGALRPAPWPRVERVRRPPHPLPAAGGQGRRALGLSGPAPGCPPGAAVRPDAGWDRPRAPRPGRTPPPGGPAPAQGPGRGG